VITNYRFGVIEQQTEIAARRAQRWRATNYVVAVPQTETVRDVNIAAQDYDDARQQLQQEISARKFPQHGQQRT
jgi:hypothetical protein